MSTAKKCLTLLLLLTACNLQAQREFRVPSFLLRSNAYDAVMERFLLSGQLTPYLEKNMPAMLREGVLQSYQAAQHVQHNVTTPLLCDIHASKKITGMFNETSFTPSALDMYPQMQSLTLEQLSQVFLIKNNTLAKVEQQRMKDWLSTLTQQIPTLKEETTNLPQPKELGQWLVDQIPPQTKILFLGELHRKEDIKRFITQLLPKLRNAHRDTPIFLFTEFLPSGFLWTNYHNPASHPYGTVFQAATDQKISVVGLEPPYVQDNILFLEYKDQAGQKQKGSIWSEPEGMRLRNEHYTTLLERYRTAYPDAFFIVYTGAAHVQYNSLFSLSNVFPAEETFVVSLYPQRRLGISATRAESLGIRPFYTSLTGEFDFATGGTFPQQVLYWQTKESARTAGFDVQLKLQEIFP